MGPIAGILLLVAGIAIFAAAPSFRAVAEPLERERSPRTKGWQTRGNLLFGYAVGALAIVVGVLAITNII